jgi:hypothetical protein
MRRSTDVTQHAHLLPERGAGFHSSESCIMASTTTRADVTIQQLFVYRGHERNYKGRYAQSFLFRTLDTESSILTDLFREVESLFRNLQ